MELGERKFRILQAIIDDYILTALPVGSRTISRKHGLNLSSATIRNEMSDLEELGYLAQPHTSAGRIPSWRAYRLYVDHIMHFTQLPSDDQRLIREMFAGRMQQMEDIAQTAAQALSELTNYTGMALSPQKQPAKIKRVQLVPISDGQALMIVVDEAGGYYESMLQVKGDISPDQYNMLSNYISAYMAGSDGQDVDFSEIIAQVREHKEVLSSILTAFAKRETAQKPRLVVLGTSKVLNQPEYNDLDKAKSMIAALETSEQLKQVMLSKAQMDFSITIGPELSIEGIQDSSLVTVAYRMGGQSGSMGVIGPTRMQYARVLSVMAAMRRAMGEILGNDDESEDT